MEQNLKKLLNKRLETLSVEDVAPRFDKEKAWAQIAGQLEPRKQNTFHLFSRWIPIAAALIIGIVIGGVTQKDGEPIRQKSASHSTVVVSKPTPVKVPVISAAPATGKIVAQENKIFKSPSKPQMQQMPKNNFAIPLPAENRLVKEATVAMPTVATTIPFGSPQKQQPRALHLLDVESDSKTALLNNAVQLPTGFSISVFISPKRLPTGNQEGVPASILGTVIR